MDDSANEYQIDIGVVNNAGSMIKVRSSWIYLSDDEILNEDLLKEKIANEMGYNGMGTHAIFDYMPELKIGDEIVGIEPLYTVDISVFANSSICTCEIKDDMWIPVAALGQKTDMVYNGKNISVSLSDEAAFTNSIDTWKGGYINVNHEENSIVPDFKFEDAKYEDGMLYLKPDSQEAFDFIRQPASTGRSIEMKVLEVDKDGVVTAFEGRGLSVLFAPHKPVCTKAMGCFSTSKKSPIKEVFETLASKAKSNLSFGKCTGKDIVQETTMTTETDMLKSELTKATNARDEAISEVNLLKSSLSEKDVLIEEQKAIIAKFEEAEAKRKEAEFEADWNTLKASMPPGLTHKPEDEAALKQKLKDDPVGFAVEMANIKFESARGSSGSQFVPDGEMSDEEKAYLELKGVKV